MAAPEIKGKFLAAIVCCFLGTGQLVAWNTLLTISDYYYQIFPDYHPSRVLTVIYQPFTLGTVAIITYKVRRMSARKLIISGYLLLTIGTLLLAVLDLATAGRGGRAPYTLLCVIVAGFGIANALVEGTMLGDLSSMSPAFVQSFVGGLGVAGVVTSVLRLITKAIFDKSPNGFRKGALLFLALSASLELVCVVLYSFVFPELPAVKYYRQRTTSTTVEQAFETDESKIELLSNKQLLRQNIDRVINLFGIHVLTLSIFPGFLYENTGRHQLGNWYALVLIVSYNVADAISRYIPLIKWLKIESRKWITGCMIARYLLIPAFYFTARNADEGWMILLTSFLGFTNGYLTACVFTQPAPTEYNVREAKALGNLLVAFMFVGITIGICFGWLWLIGKNAF